MSRFRQSLEQALAQVRAKSARHTQWPVESVPGILRLIWQAYDRLCESALTTVDILNADLQIERSVSALLHDEIQAILIERGGFASYVVSHERWEMETLDPARSRRPSQYDICFVWMDQRELKWPCEAKVLKQDTDVRAYVADIRNEFIPCVYGPFSSSGAMLGLLLDGDAENVFASISSELGQSLFGHPEFPDRHHAISNLIRQPRAQKPYPVSFTLHHMVFHLRPSRR